MTYQGDGIMLEKSKRVPLRYSRFQGASVAALFLIVMIGKAATAQTASFFGDTLAASSVTSVYGNNGTYMATSPVQSTSTITTFASSTSGVGNYDGGRYAGTSHTWTSINQSYIPAGMTSPAAPGNVGFQTAFSQTSASFDRSGTDILNSDGKSLGPADTGGFEAGTRFDQFLYADYSHVQPRGPSNVFGMQMIWLVSPTITVYNGSTIQFWTIGGAGLTSLDASYASNGDELKLLFGTSSTSTFNIGGYSNGNSTNGTATYDNGDFQKQLIDINPNQLVDGTGSVSTGTATASGSYPTRWTAYNITMSGLPTTASNPTGMTTGRFAFQYIANRVNIGADSGGGLSVGIDNFSVNLPEPGSVALLIVAGAPVWFHIRRSQRRQAAA